MRQRLQQTRCAFVLPPKARTKGRFLGGSRQAQWGLRTMPYLEEQARAQSPEASTRADLRRGLKPFKAVLPIFVRHTRCVNEGRRRGKTPGLSAASIQAGQARRSDVPARSSSRQEVGHYVQHYRPVIASSDSPLLGSSDGIESLLGKAKQRLEAHGRSALNTSLLLIPCLCGELTQDLVAEALTMVRVQDVTT
ncbi:MAG TPA: hypothetical protein VLQ80_14630 [Candidatus Saccharimonadia bacterium]|nr:hypothetical protein [Candidatus Saccharimonadia bacterium]